MALILLLHNCESWGKEHADQASLGQAYAFLGRSVLMLARRLVSVVLFPSLLGTACWGRRICRKGGVVDIQCDLQKPGYKTRLDIAPYCSVHRSNRFNMVFAYYLVTILSTIAMHSGVGTT
jgi:hypothetical protein